MAAVEASWIEEGVLVTGAQREITVVVQFRSSSDPELGSWTSSEFALGPEESLTVAVDPPRGVVGEGLAVVAAKVLAYGPEGRQDGYATGAGVAFTVVTGGLPATFHTKLEEALVPGCLDEIVDEGEEIVGIAPDAIPSGCIARVDEVEL